MEEALKDAVICCRREIYRPAVTMLGKAMEGAWIQLGIALANAGHVPKGKDKDEYMEWLSSNAISVASIISHVDDVRKLISRTDRIWKESGVRREELQSAVLWSDTVRHTRNAIHFGKEPTIAYTYEGVAVLLIAGSTSLKMMYKVKRAAE